MIPARRARTGMDGMHRKAGELMPMDEDVEVGGATWELDSPEDVELDELDGMFTDF